MPDKSFVNFKISGMTTANFAVLTLLASLLYAVQSDATYYTRSKFCYNNTHLHIYT